MAKALPALLLIAIPAFSAAHEEAEKGLQRIEALRVKINQIDQEVVTLLNRRAKVALEIGKVKQEIGKAVLDSKREEQVLKNLHDANYGPISDQALRSVYQAIMAAMKQLQRAQ